MERLNEEINEQCYAHTCQVSIYEEVYTLPVVDYSYILTSINK